MVRVRYNTNDENTLVSKPLNSVNGVFRAVITRAEKGWVTFVEHLSASGQEEEVWERIGTTKSTKNLAVAKGHAKKHLKELGVRFLEEVRQRESNEQANY